MRIRGRRWFLLLVILLAVSSAVKSEEDLDEIDFEEEEEEEEGDERSDKKISASLPIQRNLINNQTEKIRDAIESAMKTPEKREQIGEVLPIIRSMSPPQKLVMATLISSRISSNDTTPPPFEEVRSLFGSENRENATRDLMLPISMDIAKIISDDTPEELPEAQELRYVHPGKRRRPYYRQPPIRRPFPVNRRNVRPEGSRPKPNRPASRPVDLKRAPTESECTFFSSTVCLEAIDYPREAILRSIRSNKDMATALLTDYKMEDNGIVENDLPVPLPLENKFEFRQENRFENNEIKRRSDYASSYLDNVEEGFTCSTQVRYARPQLARAASGVWKYIINTGEHTQTLRLEKCTNPQASCSFITENYRSSCVQVYNYHRLLTWDATLGLHMDIFKVPTCCSCHVHGYSEIYPPHKKNPPQKPKESFPGVEFASESQDDDFGESSKPTNFGNKNSPSAGFDLSSGFLNDSPAYENDLVDAPNYQLSNSKPFIETVSSRPGFAIPGRTRPKKQPAPRPFDNLPQQHAPNTRAPGYTGPLSKPSRPGGRPSRPFRRESTSHVDFSGSRRNITNGNRYSQQYDQEIDASMKLQNSGFDDEYTQEPHRRVNYNYHPIIDFFKPEASMLQSPQPQLATQPAPVQSNSDSWKPMISP